MKKDVEDYFSENDWIFLHNGNLLKIHHQSQCEGFSCCVHNPSEHALDKAPLDWDGWRRQMMRICEHKIYHPDPDDLAFKRYYFGPVTYAWVGWDYHSGCDGCCEEWPEEDGDVEEG